MLVAQHLRRSACGTRMALAHLYRGQPSPSPLRPLPRTPIIIDAPLLVPGGRYFSAGPASSPTPVSSDDLEGLSEMEAHLIPVAVAARVLQLRDGAALTQKDVKDAYRSKALELHPDRNRDDPQSAAREFKLVKRCYEVAMRAASHQEVVAANAAGRGAWKESMHLRKKARKPLKKR
jgi:hypothetical protein